MFFRSFLLVFVLCSFDHFAPSQQALILILSGVVILSQSNNTIDLRRAHQIVIIVTVAHPITL